MTILPDPLPALLISIPEGVLDLGWGHPSPRLHPTEALQIASERVLSRQSAMPLQYGAAQGFGPLLEGLAHFLSSQDAYGNLPVNPVSLFLTAGASQGIDLATTIFAGSGDTVFVEEPTYYLIGRIFLDHGLNVVGVPTDRDGLDVDALDLMLQDGHRPRLLYVIPTYQNPTGATLTPQRRHRLIQLAQRYGFTILADEVYQLLHYGPPPPPPLATMDDTDHGCVISLGSFSKILAPGVGSRLAWDHPTLRGLRGRSQRRRVEPFRGGYGPGHSGPGTAPGELGQPAASLYHEERRRCQDIGHRPGRPSGFQSAGRRLFLLADTG